MESAPPPAANEGAAAVAEEGGAPVKPGTVASIKEAYEQMQRPAAAAATTAPAPIAISTDAGSATPATASVNAKTEAEAAPTTPTGRGANQFPEQVRQIAERAKRMNASHAAIAEFWRGVIGAESEMVEKVRRQTRRMPCSRATSPHGLTRASGGEGVGDFFSTRKRTSRRLRWRARRAASSSSRRRSWPCCRPCSGPRVCTCR